MCGEAKGTEKKRAERERERSDQRRGRCGMRSEEKRTHGLGPENVRRGCSTLGFWVGWGLGRREERRRAFVEVRREERDERRA